MPIPQPLHPVRSIVRPAGRAPVVALAVIGSLSLLGAAAGTGRAADRTILGQRLTIADIAASDPTRRRVYHAVAARAGTVGRDDVAREVGIGRTLAAFHLDKLAEAGLLDFCFERGPAGGRPAKVYRRSASEMTVSVPPRSYVDAAELLAEAVEKAGADLVLHSVAEQHGRKAKPGDMWEALRERGYEPCREDGVIKLEVR